MLTKVKRTEKFLLFFLILFIFNSVKASIDDYLPRDPGPTSSNYGNTGLLEMPTARLMDEGSFKFGINSSYPYEVTALTATPFSWLEATFRYNEIKNQPYGPVAFSGNQTLKDKSFDFKFLVLQESDYLPNVVLGFRDIGGTGLFSSEYIAASKAFGPLDLTVGMGWGQLGRESNVSNPFISLKDSFRSRNNGYGQGGKVAFRNWFSGEDVGLFGGLEYRFKRYGTRLKIEYDTSSQDKPLPPLTPLNVSSKINIGLSFPLGQWGDFSFGYQRGNVFQFSFFLKGNYSEKNLVPKFSDPAPPLARLTPNQKKRLKDDEDLYYSALLANLNKNQLYLQAATKSENKVEVTINQNKYRNFPRAAGRAARIVSSLSPDDIEVVEIYSLNANTEMNKISLHRKKFLAAVENKISSEELLLSSEISSPEGKHLDRAKFAPPTKVPDIAFKMGPALKSQIGGPEAFFMGQLFWKIDAIVLLSRGFTLYNSIGLSLYDNFEFANPSASEIPHVRSDIQQYLKQGKNNISKMKIDYFWSPGKDWLTRVDFGLLEEMFGGVGGEIMYRPFKSKYALGLVAHRVKQRDFDQRFGFRDYKVNTGHFEFFYQFPSEVTAAVLAGQYLAGDRGVTLDLSKRFRTGFRLGVFATKTNLSSEEFGEGSFDKGFYFQIPTDIFLPSYSTGSVSFGFHPLTKDGGAFLFNHNALWSLYGNSEYDAIIRDWNYILD